MGFKLFGTADLDVEDVAVEQALARSAAIRPAEPSS
ncbi:hypothetical protein DSM104299_01171 [Baekduia alba]|nr:hypothetical protein DSM104299_01171 [Baekduia alba]